MPSSKQMTVAATTRTEALTPREAVTGKCVHTQELPPYRIRSLQDSASTPSTVWTMVTITIALAISAVACKANMERTHGSCSFASDVMKFPVRSYELLPAITMHMHQGVPQAKCIVHDTNKKSLGDVQVLPR